MDGIPVGAGVILKRQLCQFAPRDAELGGVETTPRNREVAEVGCIMKKQQRWVVATTRKGIAVMKLKTP